MSKLPAVLFVCVENSCRSQIAEAFAKIHGEGAIEVYSAGSRPSEIVNPKAIETMDELNYNLRQHKSKLLEDIPLQEYEYAITMGCGNECLSVVAKHREDWKIPDPKHMGKKEFQEVRNFIETKVKKLITTICN